jgi:hypothetical protein
MAVIEACGAFTNSLCPNLASSGQKMLRLKVEEEVEGDLLQPAVSHMLLPSTANLVWQVENIWN